MSGRKPPVPVGTERAARPPFAESPTNRKALVHPLNAPCAANNSSPETSRWDALMDSWIENYPKFNAVKGDVDITELPVVFYYENGKLLH